MGLNLHHIVRTAIHSVRDDQTATLYRSLGVSTRNSRGEKSPTYEPGIEVSIQIQSVNPSTLQLSNNINLSTLTRKIYMYAEDTLDTKPQPLYRPLGKGGDVIVDEKSRQWLITDLLEDFSEQGWVCLQATMQQKPITMTIIEPEPEPEPEEETDTETDSETDTEATEGEDTTNEDSENG